MSARWLSDMDPITDLLEEAQGPVTSERLAGIALELSLFSEKLKEGLDGIKEHLRSAARERLEPDSPTVSLPGVSQKGSPIGTVHVTFPERQVQVSKAADLEALKTQIGDDQMSIYFETVTVYKPHKNITAMIKSPEDPVLNVLEYVEQTPRVSFKHKR